MTKRREQILATIEDSVTDLLYYGRKEDGDLPRGDIEAAIEAGEVTIDDMVNVYRHYLEEWLR